MPRVITTSWIPEDPENWNAELESELNNNLGLLMDNFIESREYMKHMPNGIMIKQDRNIAMFLDTETGDKKCFGIFNETELVKIA